MITSFQSQPINHTLCIVVAFVFRGLSAVRYRIHLNLCIALAAAQLLFITGIEATDIKVRIAHFITLIVNTNSKFLVLEIIYKLQIPPLMEKMCTTISSVSD